MGRGKSRARWVTSLAYSDGKHIFVYRGVSEGEFDSSREIKGFGFDNQFYPLGENKTYFELEELGLKDNYSARSKALRSLVDNNIYLSKPVESILEWNGEYQ